MIEENELKNGSKHAVVWQTGNDDNPVPEPALTLCQYSGPMILLKQEGSEILINTETIPELIKILKKFSKEK